MCVHNILCVCYDGHALSIVESLNAALLVLGPGWGGVWFRLLGWPVGNLSALQHRPPVSLHVVEQRDDDSRAHQQLRQNEGDEISLLHVTFLFLHLHAHLMCEAFVMQDKNMQSNPSINRLRYDTQLNSQRVGCCLPSVPYVCVGHALAQQPTSGKYTHPWLPDSWWQGFLWQQTKQVTSCAIHLITGVWGFKRSGCHRYPVLEKQSLRLRYSMFLWYKPALPNRPTLLQLWNDCLFLSCFES